MKLFKKLTALVTAIILATAFSVPVFATNQYFGAHFFPQPDPNAQTWSEADDGTMTALDKSATNILTMAYVPAGIDASKIDMLPRNFTWEFDMLIPEVQKEDVWAGFYVRATQPQTGAGGYLFYINSDGFKMLDGESVTPIVDEPLGKELIKANEFNTVKVKLDGKNVEFWINGKSVFKKDNIIESNGYLGFSCLNYIGSYKNSNFTIDGLTHKELVPEYEVVEAKEETEAPAQSSEAAGEVIQTPVEENEQKPAASSSLDQTMLIIIIAVSVVAVALIVAITVIVLNKKK